MITEYIATYLIGSLSTALFCIQLSRKNGEPLSDWDNSDVDSCLIFSVGWPFWMPFIGWAYLIDILNIKISFNLKTFLTKERSFFKKGGLKP